VSYTGIRETERIVEQEERKEKKISKFKCNESFSLNFGVSSSSSSPGIGV
jgi:hypothetical protein